MKNNGRSLEEQRNALLEQIHASRAVYRRMLTQGESIETASAHEHAAAGTDIREEAATKAMPDTASATSRASLKEKDFPRSMTMRWIMEHPFYTAAAIVGVAMLIPKAAGAGKRAGRKLSSKKRGKAAMPPSGPMPPPGQAHAYGASQGEYPQGGYPQTVYIQQPPQKAGALAGAAAFGGTALTSIITIATMVLRDPAKMQMAMRLFSTASSYLRKRQNQQTTQVKRTQ